MFDLCLFVFLVGLWHSNVFWASFVDESLGIGKCARVGDCDVVPRSITIS